MLHMATPTLITAGSSGGKTYQDWLAHTATIAPGTANGSEYPGPSDRIARVTNISEAGVMWGSSDYYEYTYDSAYNRIIQHAMATITDFYDYAVNKEVVVSSISLGAYTEFQPFYKNNYTSYAYGEFGACYLQYLLYWTPDGAKKINARASSIVNYTAPGWA